jgi:hypothetical protein
MEPSDDLHGDDGNPTSQRASTFVLRIWFEPLGGERGPMRGTLSWLGGPVIGAFQSMAELVALLERTLNAATPPASRHSI